MVRLRQPIDIEHNGAAGPLPDVPRRALLLSNNPVADRLALIEGACAASGLELVRLGGDSGQAEDPRHALADVEIVIGYGRSVLEAMAAGRAAYVYDRYGGDGWVTVDSYPALEADGFAGRERETTIDEARLRSDLRSYAATMGPANRDLVVANHRANVHAQELVELLRPLASPQRDRLPHEEMARLVRLEWRARVEAQALRRELSRRDEQLELSKRQTADAEARTEQTRSNYESTLSWRATERLRAARDLVRRLGGRR